MAGVARIRTVDMFVATILETKLARTETEAVRLYMVVRAALRKMLPARTQGANLERLIQEAHGPFRRAAKRRWR